MRHPLPLKTLELSLDGAVAHVILKRPEARNALDISMARELLQVALFCDGNPEVRAILMRGHETFCPGGDLKSLTAKGEAMPAHLRELTTHVNAALVKFAKMSAPLVVAVEGVAAGAGLSFALAADITLAAESSRFTPAYTKIGFIPGVGATYFLPRVVGWKRATELLLTNRILGAREALDMGIVSRVVPDGRLVEEAVSLTTQLAGGPTLSFGHVKRLLHLSATHPLEAQLEAEARLLCELARTATVKEGVSAFLEKRPAKFPDPSPS